MPTDGPTIRFLSECGPPPRRHEIVEGLLASSEIALLTGDPGGGKTAVAAALTAAITTASRFLGRATHSGPAVFIAGERPASVQRRLVAAGAAPDWTTLITGRVHLLSDTESIIDLVEAKVPEPRLIVLDTFAALTVGINENGSDMGRAAHCLRQISEAFPTAALVVVHHLSKGGGDGAFQSARGHTSLLAAVDLELRSEAKKNDRWLRVNKANHVATDQKLPFKLGKVEVGGEPEVAATGTAVVPAELAHQSQVNKRRATETVARLDSMLPPDPTVEDVLDAALKLGLLDNTKPENQRSVATRWKRRVTDLRRETHRPEDVRNAG